MVEPSVLYACTSFIQFLKTWGIAEGNFYRPQTKLWKGNVFTLVCDSVHSGGLCQGDPPPYGNQRAVRILLECILCNVYFNCNFF